METQLEKPLKVRKPKTPPAAPVADTRTGDLLAGTALAVVTPTTPAALTMPSMEPAVYVATVFEPFNTKFKEAQATADLVALDEHELAEKTAVQQALPEEQRRDIVLLNLSTKDGMETAKKYRAVFRDEVRCAAENMRKERKEPYLLIGRLLDSSYKDIETVATPYETRFHKAIKAEEERAAIEKLERERKEAERKAAIRAKIDAISGLPAQLGNADAATLRAELEKLAAIEPTEADYQEYLGEAALAIDTIGNILAGMLGSAIDREAAEARRLAEQEATNKRLDEQSAANKREAARLEEEKAEQARTAKLLADEREQNRLAMEAIKTLKALATTGGDAFPLARALDLVKAIPAFVGAMGEMVQTSQEMAVFGLERKLEAALPAAHAEALEMNAAVDAERAAPLALVTEELDEPTPIDWDAAPADHEPLAVDAAVPAALVPAPVQAHAALPESWSAIDEAVTDSDIIETVSTRYGWNWVDTVERMRSIDFLEARQAA